MTWPRSRRACGRGDLLIAAVMPIVVYLPVVTAWWLGDDPAILQHVVEFDVWANFFVPDVWRAYSTANFTPLLILSIAIDFQLFGFSPTLYYLHQLLLVASASALGFYLLCLIVERWIAALVVVLIILSPPVAEVAGSLMTRHYLEGLILGLGSILVFRVATERRSRALYWVSAVLYLVASLAKEIYVLIPLFLFAFFVGQNLGEAKRALAPFSGAVLVYGIWRLYILGWSGATSGYGDLYSAGASRSFAELIAHIFSAHIGVGDGWRSAALIFVGLWGAACILVRGRSHGIVALSFLTIGVWAPIFFLAPNLADRYLLLPTIWCFTIAGVGVSGLSQALGNVDLPRRAFSFGIVVLLTASPVLAANNLVDGRERARGSEEGKFTWTADSSSVLLKPHGPPWYHRSLAWLRVRVGDGERGPAVCYDPCLCKLDGFDEIFVYENGDLRATAAAVSKCAPSEPRPMSVSMTYAGEEGLLYWQLASERDGDWFMARAPEFFARGIPSEGEIPFLYRRPMKLKFIFVSEEGWTSASPVLGFGVEGKTITDRLELYWERE